MISSRGILDRGGGDYKYPGPFEWEETRTIWGEQGKYYRSGTMSCSVAIASSPAFSPSRISISCKGSPETLALNPCSPSASPRSCSSSPFRPQRFQRAPSGLREVGAAIGTSPSGTAVDASLPSSPPPSSSGGSCSLSKRKRPGRINIPLAKALTFAPEVSDDWREVEVESARYTVYCKRGRKRLVMEDRHKAFFGIFDGHGGKRAAEFASENLGEFIAEEMLTTSGAGANDIAKAVRIGYLKTDAEFLKEEVDGGACCVTALLRDGDLIVSNVGDCRAVLSRAGKAEALTSDHRPSREDERDRIESLVRELEIHISNNGLYQSRRLESLTSKQTVSIQEAVDVARPLCIDADSASSLSACKNLVDLSAKRGSLDDISVMIVKLQHYV
ncbi:hypothetical protein BHE74_00052294 [Ensete ventricosum]|nr:hypothetical protein GW17_00019426 [Ensete ventricosum]RWW42177.1 hypothetical protein BHE74_00052294 [Ensete ventricosum]